MCSVSKAAKSYAGIPSKLLKKLCTGVNQVMDSAITLIADGRLFYRGHDVLSLTASRTVEEVAGLIWLGDFEADIQAGF